MECALSSEKIIFYVIIVTITIINLLLSSFGTETEWYETVKGDSNPWVIRILWMIAVIVSFISLIVTLRCLNKAPKIIPLLYLISTLLSLMFSIIFYYYHNIEVSLWLIIGIFAYSFCLVGYTWNVAPLSAMFMLPSLAIQLYLIYFMINLVTRN